MINSREEILSRQNELKPVEYVTWGVIIAGAIWVWLLPLSIEIRVIAYGLLAITAIYEFLFFRWLLPRRQHRAWVVFLPSISNVLIVTIFYYLLGDVLSVQIIYIASIAGAAVRLGRKSGVAIAVLVAVAAAAVDLVKLNPLVVVLSSASVSLVVYVFAGYLTGFLAERARSQTVQMARSNRDLRLLLDVSTAMASLDSEEILPRLAEKIAQGLPATYSSIFLLDARRYKLVASAVFPIRNLSEWHWDLGKEFPLNQMPKSRQALYEKRPVVVRRDDPVTEGDEIERAALMFEHIRCICIVPMAYESQDIGVICIGESRGKEREPFDQEKLDLLQTLAAQASVSIGNTRLHDAVMRQAERVQVLNEVTSAITSTLEMGDLLELIHQQIRRVIQSDTYYVGLHRTGDAMIDLRIVIDKGERFPAQSLPYGEGLSSRVLETRKPILLHRRADRDALGILPVPVGTAQLSESWMGVPILVDDLLNGVLVVASYVPYAFDEDDLALLTNIAQQAARALENAQRHAEVKEQARRDSLTGVFTHGYFLERLREELFAAQVERTAMSLIMLDIDFFKEYNDAYGHVLGDQVLRQVVIAIRESVKETDSVGRWGGEEFGIILPKANSGQAQNVATRIRGVVAALNLVDTAGGKLPVLTISQGIATWPNPATDANQLVALADAALYEAKRQGRDQVHVAEKM